MKNLWNKIKLAWKGRDIAQSLISIKSKWKEPSFWAMLIGQAGSLAGSLNGVISPRTGIIISAITTQAYTYVRGLAKAQSDGVKPYKTTSEFIFSIIGVINATIIDMQTGGVSTPWLAGASVLALHAIAANRDLANMRPLEAQAAGVEKEPEKQ